MSDDLDITQKEIYNGPLKGLVEIYDPPSLHTQMVLGGQTIIGTVVDMSGHRYYMLLGRCNVPPERLQPGSVVYFYTTNSLLATHIFWRGR